MYFKALVGLHGREGGGLLRRRSHQTVHISNCELSTHFLGRRQLFRAGKRQIRSPATAATLCVSVSRLSEFVNETRRPSE